MLSAGRQAAKQGDCIMSGLVTEPNIPDPDGFYSELLGVHEGRSPEESHALNARLVLILANHIGDRDVLREAFALAADAGN
jgi:hypothetical protein